MSAEAWRLEAADFGRGSSSSLELWTEKEGLLSRVAHDLCLRADAVEVSLKDEVLEVAVAVNSIRVLGQVKRGQVKALSGREHAEIEKNLQSGAVLNARRWPQAVYRGRVSLSESRARVAGTLELRGQERPLALESSWRREGDAALVSGEVAVRQSEWGITPFSAMLGAIKVKDVLRVRWSLRLQRAPAR